MKDNASLSGTTAVLQSTTWTAGWICSLVSYYNSALQSCKGDRHRDIWTRRNERAFHTKI